MIRFVRVIFFLCIIASPHAALASCSMPEKSYFETSRLYDIATALLMAGAFIYFIAAKSYPEKYKMSRKKTVALYAAIFIVLCIIPYASRPTCCLAERHQATSYRSNSDCGCCCFERPPVKLGEREEELQQKAEDGDAAALYELGLFYFANSYSDEDDEIGLKWLRKAAEGGNKDAQQYIASGAFGMANAAEKKKWQDVIDAEKNKPR